MSSTPVLHRDGRSRRRVAWLIKDWPQADRAAWCRARETGGLLDDAGRAAAWRPQSIRAALSVYGALLAFLDRHGLLIIEQSPSDRLTPAVLDSYVAALRSSRSTVTVASYVGVLGMMLQALEPDADWSWLRLVHRKLKHRAEPSRNKRARIVPAAELLALGQDLMWEGQFGTGLDPQQRLLAYRDGIMIATLICLPMRVSNFLGIEIGCQLFRVSKGWALSFSTEETKNHRALRFPYPAELNAAFGHYLAVVRPQLIAVGHERHPRGGKRPAGEHLWLSIDGTPYRPAALDRMLKKRTTARFGHAINPHLFRDCAATSIMMKLPEQVRIAASILGHASLHTTQRYYILANSQRELSRYQAEIQILRQRGKAITP